MQRGIDAAGTGAVRAAGTLLHLFHELVSVFGAFGQEGEDRDAEFTDFEKPAPIELETVKLAPLELAEFSGNVYKWRSHAGAQPPVFAEMRPPFFSHIADTSLDISQDVYRTIYRRVKTFLRDGISGVAAHIEKAGRLDDQPSGYSQSEGCSYVQVKQGRREDQVEHRSGIKPGSYSLQNSHGRGRTLAMGEDRKNGCVGRESAEESAGHWSQ